MRSLRTWLGTPTGRPVTRVPQSAIEHWADPPEPPPERVVGPVEAAVEADLEALGRLRTGQAYLAASARKLARVIDSRGDDEAASTLAKAVDTLRAVMNQLMAKESSDPNDLRDIRTSLSTPSAGGSSVSPPLRYPKES
jgi:hypothetical protein